MDIDTSRGAKGISPREWKHNTMLLPRKRLSDITNMSMRDLSDGVVSENHENRKTVSPVNEYIAKLLKENNALMRALAERNTEVQNLRLIVAKLNQQNWQLAQAQSQMLAELNLGKDRLKAAQHELGCTSTVLKLKTKELEEQKKLNKQNMRMQNITNLEGHIKHVEAAVETSQLASHKRTSLPNRKRPQRCQSLAPMPITKQITTEENRRRPLRRKSIIFKAESSCVPTEDLFEIEDAKFPICSGNNNNGEIKDEISLQPKSTKSSVKEEDEEVQFTSSLKRSVGRPLRRAAEKVNNNGEIKDEVSLQPKSTKSLVKEEDEEVQFTSSLKRTSLGRPLRRAAEKVNCYKELPLNTKLRR